MIRKDIKMGYQFKPYIKEGQKMQLPKRRKKGKLSIKYYTKNKIVCNMSDWGELMNSERVKFSK